LTDFYLTFGVIDRNLERDMEPLDAEANALRFKLYNASMEGDLENVMKLLDTDTIIDGKEMALSCASRRGHTKIVEMLLETGADVHHRDDGALAWASSRGHIGIVKLLLEAGADIHAKDDWSLRGASSYGHPRVVEILLEYGANVHADDNYSINEASSLIAGDGIVEIVELLLDYGADRERLHPTATPEMREYIPVNPRRVWVVGIEQKLKG